MLRWLLTLLLLACGANAYRVPHYKPLLRLLRADIGSRCAMPMCLAKRKDGGSEKRGFGSAETSKKETSAKIPFLNKNRDRESLVQALTRAKKEKMGVEYDQDDLDGLRGKVGKSIPKTAEDDEEAMLARGRAALAKMQRESAPPKWSPYKQETSVQIDGSSTIDRDGGIMPEVVSERMISRVKIFAGLPALLGIALFSGNYYLNVQYDMDLAPNIIGYISIACVLLSFAGVTYGVMSTSWDETVVGSDLGLEEARMNIKMAWTDQMQRENTVANEVLLKNEEEDAAAEGVFISTRAVEESQRASEESQVETKK
jgi:hypothetical protein